MPELSFIPWFAWIALAGILVGGVITLVKTVGERNDSTAKAFAQNTAVNEALVARLETIDARLARLEKTLDDIPS